MSGYRALEDLLQAALVSLHGGDSLTALASLEQVQSRCGEGALTGQEREQLSQLHTRCVAAAESLHALLHKEVVQLRAAKSAARAYGRLPM